MQRTKAWNTGEIRQVSMHGKGKHSGDQVNRHDSKGLSETDAARLARKMVMLGTRGHGREPLGSVVVWDNNLACNRVRIHEV